METLRVLPYSQDWNTNSYSPVAEAEQITQDVALANTLSDKGHEEAMWEYTLASFSTLVDRKSGFDDEGQNDAEGHFRSFAVSDEQHGALQLTFDRAPAVERQGDGVLGSVTFARKTDEGVEEALVYNLVDTTEGLGVTREARVYDPDQADFSEVGAYRTFTDLPPLTNDEALSVISYSEQFALDDTTSEAQSSAEASADSGTAAGGDE